MSHDGKLRLAIINAIAPPAAGSRSERTRHLAAALVRLGHDVTVVRGELPEGFSPIDESTMTALADGGVRETAISGGAVARWKYAQEHRGQASLRRVLAEFAWPDWWSVFGLRARRWYRMNADQFDAVITSAFPWSDLLVGPLASERTGVVWIADYGDPWGIARRGEAWRETLEHRVEKSLLRGCHGVLVTTEPTRQAFIDRYGLSADRVVVVTAGVEPAHLDPPPSEGPMTFLHAGAVYGPRVAPDRFLSVFEEWRQRTPRGARLLWCGPIDDASCREYVLKVADRYIPYANQECLRQMESESHAILVFGNYGGQQIPAKIWRGLGANRPLFVVIESQSDPMTRLSALEGSAVFAVDDREAISIALDEVSRTVGAWEYHPEKQHPRVGELSWTSKAQQVCRLVRQELDRADGAPRRRHWSAMGSAVAIFSVLGLRPVSRWMSGGY